MDLHLDDLTLQRTKRNNLSDIITGALSIIVGHMLKLLGKKILVNGFTWYSRYVRSFCFVYLLFS